MPRPTLLIHWRLAGHVRRSIGRGAPADSRPARPSLFGRALSRQNVVAWGAFATLLAAGCHGEAPVAKTAPTIVTAAKPLDREVSDLVYFTGRTDGSEFVEVRARVSGYLTKVLFRPGTRIKQGDPLFEIDARPYQVTFNQAEADLERAKARQTRTAADLARNEKLVKSGAVSKESYDQFVGDQAEAAAAVKSAQAAVERAELDLSWTKIFAPISGVVSREQLTVGNLVRADQTQLTTILREDPMYVYFDLDEKTLLRILELIREGKFKSARENKVPIRMALGNENDYSLAGFVNFVENRVDPSSGTMRIRGEFANPLQANGSVRLAAGLFGRVRFELGSPYQALLVTERAIQSDQNQKFVYVVNDKNEVERRDVILGMLDAGLRVVSEGLKPTDRVIINGIQRVRPGVPVDAKLVVMPEAAGHLPPSPAPPGPQAPAEATPTVPAPAVQTPDAKPADPAPGGQSPSEAKSSGLGRPAGDAAFTLG
ncbi:MAG TPA: efflux RND transporter periplasmic adaptor subunit [Pirellulales bacterium]|nr:efflux RND transporter periplasmic adaptor subunit [Pirellulales bacterium]